MKEWDKGWIHFSKKTRRGIFVLLILFALVAISPRLYYNYIASIPKYDIQITPLSEDEDDLHDGNSAIASNYHQPQGPFDPNQYSIEEWMAIGLSKKQAQSILNYLHTGARFRIKADLKKMYVIDSELYELLKPKINLPDAVASNSDNYQNKNKEAFSNFTDSLAQQNRAELGTPQESHIIEPILINRASDKELQKIPGIGPFFAKEIIKMRDSYGGIINSNQLLEIYKMDTDKLNKILPFLIIDKEHVNRININTASEQKLEKHPLISNDMAHSIVYFRKNYKKYKSLDELLLSPYIDSKTLNNLKPYLKVE